MTKGSEELLRKAQPSYMGPAVFKTLPPPWSAQDGSKIGNAHRKNEEGVGPAAERSRIGYLEGPAQRSMLEQLSRR